MQGPAGLWVAGQEQGSQGVYEVTLSLPGPQSPLVTRGHATSQSIRSESKVQAHSSE